MVTIVARVVGALLALAGLALTVVGVWFATQLGTSGTAEFTVRPATGDPLVIRPDVLNRVDADVVVTATGLRLQVAGGIDLQVDGSPVSLPDTTIHRGTMLSGVPNLSLAIGYVNASWTLKIGILCEYLCQLLTHMDEHGYDTARVVAEPGRPTRPLLDFGAGYVQRSLDELPRQGPRAPWLMSLDHQSDRRLLKGPVVAEGLQLTGPRTRSHQEVTA